MVINLYFIANHLHALEMKTVPNAHHSIMWIDECAFFLFRFETEELRSTDLRNLKQ